MLKKAGIVVAASAASLLALSPLAFAGDDHGGIDKDSKGLISGLNGNNVDVPIQACNNNVPVNVLGVQVPVEDGSLLNGLTGSVNGESKSGDSTTDQGDSCAQGGGAGDSQGGSHGGDKGTK